MYEFTSRVRYSEVDAKCNLKLSSLANYFQDCTSFQSEDLGIGVDYWASNKRTWVLNYWQIDILRYPKLADYITIKTIPYDMKSFVGYRNFCIKDNATEEIVVKANTIWTYIDTERLRPARVGDEEKDKYALGEKLDMEYVDHKIVIEGEREVREPIAVTEFMIDTNNHVNNAKYIDIALGYVPDGEHVCRLRTEYKNAAVLGDTMTPVVYKQDNGVIVAFENETDNKLYAVCQFIYGNN